MNKLLTVALSLATALSGTPVLAGPAAVTTPFVQSNTGYAPVPDAKVETIGCNNMTNCPSLNPRWDRGHRPERGNYNRHDRGWDHNRGWDRDRRDYGERRHYRNRNNTGAVIGGLAAGAILGGIIASQPGVRSGGSHADYCRAKYRSYRAYDNTFQPNNGPRRQCR